MLTNHGGIDIGLGFILLWAAPGGGDTSRGDLSGQMQEIAGDALWRGPGPGEPLRCGQSDQPALVIAGDLDGQVVGGHIEFGLFLLMRPFDAALEQR